MATCKTALLRLGAGEDPQATLLRLTEEVERAAIEARARLDAGDPLSAVELREHGLWSNGKDGYPGIPYWEDDFIRNYSELGIQWAACRASDVSWYTVNEHRAKDLRFALRMRAAGEMAKEVLEAEARRRALAGSDLMMIFILKRLDPAYRDANQRTMTLVGDPENPIEVRHKVESEEFERKALAVIERLGTAREAEREAALEGKTLIEEFQGREAPSLVLEGRVEVKDG